ncbi:MAG: DMT family transporter [Candidatus Bathyarchaeota archaeon]|nr:DMT family transporter [Candidatus Bathyarchaeota archaeon]
MQLKSYFTISSVVVMWGMSFILLKLGLDTITPLSIALFRFLLLFPLILSRLYHHRKGLLSRVRRDWKRFSFLGLTGVTLYHVFQNYGLSYTTASNASLIISTNPILIAVLDHISNHESVNRYQVLSILLAFFGVILVIRPLHWALNPVGVFGDILTVGSAASWALYSVYSRPMVAHYSVEQVTWITILFGTVYLFPITFLVETPQIPSSLWIWTLLLVLSFLCSGLAYFFWSKALKELSPTRAGVFLYFLPVISVSLASVVLGEVVDSLFLVGASFVITGVYLTQRFSRD